MYVGEDHESNNTFFFYSEARKILRRVSVLFDALVEKRADINSDYHACKS